MKKILITGGAGFIGSHLVRLFVNKYPDYFITNLDALTYAGNLENLTDIEASSNYAFVKGDITDESFVEALFEEKKFDAVIHLAAESHVDRSILDPMSCVKTNVLGTGVLLNAAKDNVKYLSTLEKYTDPLYNGTPSQIIDSLPALMNNVKMMLTIARYYRSVQVPTISC